MTGQEQSPFRVLLDCDHPTASFFIDESGAISKDRFFAVGVLKLAEPSALFREVQRIRDRRNWHDEFHFTKLTKNRLGLYCEIVDLLAARDDWQFWCFIADRELADPVDRWETQWLAYEKMAEQLIIAAIRPYEVASAVADKYSSPPDVQFEIDVRRRVNLRLKRCAVATLYRSDSLAMDGLQLVDILTGAVAFEFRRASSLAGSGNPKATMAEYVRTRLCTGYTTFTDVPVVSDRFSVRRYNHGRWTPKVSSGG